MELAQAYFSEISAKLRQTTEVQIVDNEIEQILNSKDLKEVTIKGQSKIVGRKAFDFVLPNHRGANMRLSDLFKDKPTILVFYPKDFTLICTKQLCAYRDAINTFRRLGVQLVGVSPDTVESHSRFMDKYDFPFPLLSDSGGKIAKIYKCASFWMMNKSSRAVFIVNRAGIVLYRYVEPTILTSRSATDLVSVVEDLRNNRLL